MAGAVLVGILGGLNTAAAESSGCDAILKQGIFNKVFVKQGGRVTEDFHDWECQSDFSSHDQARDAGVGVGVPIYGVPVQINGTFTSKDKDTFKKEKCSDRKYRYDSAHYLDLLKQEASPAIVDAWLQCKKAAATNDPANSSPGLKCSLTATSDSATFFIRFIPNGTSDTPPKLTAAAITKGLTCKGLAALKKLSFAGDVFQCQRKIGEEQGFAAASVSLNTAKGSCASELAEMPGSPLVIDASYPEIPGGLTVIDRPYVKFATGGKIRVRNGGTLVIRTMRLDAGDAAVIDGRGEPGTRGGQGESGCGGNSPPGSPGTRCSFPASSDKEYYDANNDCNARADHPDRGHKGQRGTNGGPGATVFVNAKKFSGGLTALVSGGEGGPGGPGGLGQEHVRPNSAHDKYNCPEGPTGDPGEKGPDGVYVPPQSQAAIAKNGQ